MENVATREHRHTMAPALQAYRERVGADPENQKEILREVSEEFSVTQKAILEEADAGT